MDINMPVMDGYAAARNIREHEAVTGARHPIPIMAMTATGLDGCKSSCLAAGMDGVLTKPIKRELVFQAIQKWALKQSMP